MTTGVYFCLCGGLLANLIDGEEISARFEGIPGYIKTVKFSCSSSGVDWIAQDLEQNKPDRVVIAACSPREHEETFRKMMAKAGMNPFLMQMVNIREHVGWVTPDRAAATDKAWHQIRAAISRVALQQPLERQFIDVNPDVLVIGGGPAGLKAALTLSAAGRKVALVEKSPILGGMPLLYEEVFPNMECGTCILEPVIAETLHGPESANIERFLMSEVVEIKGSFGNFVVTVEVKPRRVDLDLCIGCGECVAACPALYPNPVNSGMNQRHAMDFVFYGGLPSAPYIDEKHCTRFAEGDGCSLCKEACPIEGAVALEETPRRVERKVGAIILAVGGDLYPMDKVPGLGYGLPGVYTSLECERMFSTNGPFDGTPRLSDGSTPKSFAFIHCAGSLDEKHKDYCSGICCLEAFKLNILAGHKIEGSTATHYVKTVCVPGKDEAKLYRKAMNRQGVERVNFASLDEIAVSSASDGRPCVSIGGQARCYDAVVLMPPVVPSKSVERLGGLLDLPLDRLGFFDEMHGRLDVTSSKLRGVYLAGLCQGPMHLGQAVSQGLSACASALSALVPGRKLELEAIYATVDPERCSGCRSCMGVCPYKAITFDEAAQITAINPALCVGCGTCVAACPSNALSARHFGNDQIFAEIEGILR